MSNLNISPAACSFLYKKVTRWPWHVFFLTDGHISISTNLCLSSLPPKASARQHKNDTVPSPLEVPILVKKHLLDRKALVPDLAVRLPGRLPKSSNTSAVCSEARHRWQKKGSAGFFWAWVSQLLDIWETGLLWLNSSNLSKAKETQTTLPRDCDI